ncbi:MAG: hypothetical protein F6J96_21900 [Symploca sp. SIO1C2]|nr:hypothetical protein [Symploca sp. SIO1C2]NER50254.1 hypothetical protein [Symploca sp. SIO1A3]
MVSQKELQLLEHLKGLNLAQFEEVLFRLKIDPAIIPSSFAEQRHSSRLSKFRHKPGTSLLPSTLHNRLTLHTTKQRHLPKLPKLK